MQKAEKENKPIIYNAGATKILHFSPPKDTVCFALHWHERLEILYIRKGSLSYICGNQKGYVTAGQALVVPPRHAHYGQATTDVVYDVLMFDLRNFYNQTDACKKYLTAIFEGDADFDTILTDEETLQCIDRICQCTTPDALLAVADVYILLHLMISKGFINLNPKSREDHIRKMIEYIEQNYHKKLSTAALCKKFGYTPAYFCRKFKKSTGLSPLTYIRIYRLERAYQMIRQGEGRICEIAEKCGFSDANYFTRCFTAHYKIPPTGYKFENS